MAGPDIDDSVDYDINDKLHRFSEMLSLASQLVTELKNGATVETDADADAAFSEAADLIDRLIAANHEPTLDTATVLQRLDRMCEIIEAIDNWVVGGGFLPFGVAHPRGSTDATRAGKAQEDS